MQTSDWTQRPRRPHGRRRQKLLKIAQGNVGKRSPAHTAYLQLAWESGADIVLVQEPWVSIDGSCLINNHPGYNTYVPVDYWYSLSTRPRVITYVKKGNRYTAQQSRPWVTRDILWLNVNGLNVTNVYRPPNEPNSEATEILLNYIPPPRCVVAGDFNAKHPHWEPGIEGHNRGADIARWAANNRLALISEAGIPTHTGGHVLDLAFSNIPFAMGEVVDALHPGADHAALQLTVPVERTPEPERHRITVSDDELPTFSEIVEEGAPLLPALPRKPSAEEIDRGAQALTDLLTNALMAAGRSPSGRGHSAPWWNEDCKRALNEMRRTQLRDGFPSTAERQELHRVVRLAKRNYWRGRVEDIKNDAELYKVVNWHKLGPAIKAPPLLVNGAAVEKTSDKAQALRRGLLERFTPDDDLDVDPLEVPVVPRKILEWDTTITLEEVEATTISTKNTAPGIDNLSVRLLKAVWDHIAEYVRVIFQASLGAGHHPEPFRTAEVVMLPKVNKKDFTDIKSWRPIALLSCLSKGLERLVARRIGRIALLHEIVSPQQAGALPKRSATDLTTCLAHDIEYALETRRTATMATLDVQGAFDSVLGKRLAVRLRQQGWPPLMVKYVLSFMTKRRARVRLEDAVTGLFDVRCGLPQGSPASPILFLLYMADVLLDDPQCRFGYADDLCVLRVGGSLDENVAQLEDDIRQILSWGKDNKVAFAPAKCELMHFTRARHDYAPDVHIPDFDFTIRQVRDSEGKIAPIRWLGVWFDRKFTFQQHISTLAGKAGRVVRHIRNLANTEFGPPAESLRKAVVACILPAVTYGAETWYAGKTKLPTNNAQAKGKEVGTRQNFHITEVDRVLNGAIRAILPIWRTTPKDTIYRDAGLPTAEIALDKIRNRLAFRLRAVDERHPLIGRLAPKPVTRGRNTGGLIRARTRMQRAADLLPPFPRPKLLMQQYAPGSRESPTGGQSKEDAAKAFRAWLRTLPDTHTVVYSDGSQLEGRTGYGYALYRGRHNIRHGCGRLRQAEVFDGEVEGARHGLRAALRINNGHPIHVCLDNTAVIRGLKGEPPPSSQEAFLDFQHLATLADVRVRWVPGHVGVAGNEQADELAKQGTTLPENPDEAPTYAAVLRQCRAKTATDFRKWWADKAKPPDLYRLLKLPAKLKCPQELRLPRKVLHHLLAARSGHGDFAWYHRKFNHPNAKLDCTCGRAKAPSHLVFCRKTQEPDTKRKWPTFRPEPASQIIYWQRLLAEPKEFEHFLKVTQYFQKISPRY